MTLFKDTLNGNFEKIKKSIEKGENDIQQVFQKGYTDIHKKLDIRLKNYISEALKLSIQLDKTEISDYLITKKYNEEFIDEYFISAAKHNNLSLVKYFVEKKGANIEKFGEEALLHAVVSKHMETILYLVDKGVNINFRYGFVLRWFISYHYANSDIIDFLIEKGADIEIVIKQDDFYLDYLRKYIKKEYYLGPINERTETDA